MKTLDQLFAQHVDIESIFDGVRFHMKEQLVAGLSGSARSVFTAALHNQTKRSIMVVTHNLLQAQKVYDDLVSILPTDSVLLFPVNEMVAAELSIASPELRSQRLEVLNHLAQGKPSIIVAPIAGLKKLLPPMSNWQTNQLTFSLGDQLDIQVTTTNLVEMGYERVSIVASPGEFSIRGGILDIYPLTEEKPFRIELFDTEIDSLRQFKVEDQRSLKNLQSVTIGPVSEFMITEELLKLIAEKLHARLPHSLARIKDEKIKQTLIQSIEADCEGLLNGQKIPRLTHYLYLAFEQLSSLLDYFPSDGVIIFDEISRIFELNERIDRDDQDYYLSLLETGQVLHDIQLTHDLTDILQKSKNSFIYLSLFLRHISNTSPQNLVNLSCKPMQSFHGQMHLFKAETERWQKSGYTVILQAVNPERMAKLERTLTDFKINHTVIGQKDMLLQGVLQITKGSLTTGFELPMQKLVVLSESELFDQKKRKSVTRHKISNAERIKSYSELKVGDYVVHIKHGIGQYLGIETLEIGGIHKDYLTIRYQGSDILRVPVDQIDFVQKYVGSEGKEPKIYKLGGSDWKKTKAKTRASVQDIADKLIKLYAEREVAKGFAFLPDDDIQREFELMFPYQETDDQLRSIREIKKDMERPRPMDRLLCGDVGYGKTEVAIRAAFKAISNNKQVAILVPTTILAQQHYETMLERFQGFPIKIGILSRFRTKKQQIETLKQLKTGTIDIVVGTHRVLSQDVSFFDLGLLIVDEEQRFGVTHKERIKQLKTNVDVLTLTATPIPRTLHMSMLGVRDLSIIETPPENRFPIQTYVMEYNPSIVREAIERELSRSGQVFFLYNHVESISRMATEISALVPDARVCYGHGKMNESELEAVIYSFLEGEYDVLVSTTIIETGVDIPNVNTLIVHNADRMGLSQLYQLRGRVGRSNRIAYAYFTYQKDKVLTEVAEKRLQAIKEFTELGSGFKIAMRDLSIRGAGNLLGAEQHGFIDAVGFDMYNNMLAEAINERKGIVKHVKQTLEIDIEIDAYIPDKYIANSNQKIEMYKCFRALTDLEGLAELKDELLDRFGEYPSEVNDLLLISELKIYGIAADLAYVKQIKKNEVALVLSQEKSAIIDGAKLFEIISVYGRTVTLGMADNCLRITFMTDGLKPETWLMRAIDTLKQLPDCEKKQQPINRKTASQM